MKSSTVTVEELVRGDTRWVAVRARGAEWSWLTPEEAAELGHLWVKQYGRSATSSSIPVATKRCPKLVEAAWLRRAEFAGGPHQLRAPCSARR